MLRSGLIDYDLIYKDNLAFDVCVNHDPRCPLASPSEGSFNGLLRFTDRIMQFDFDRQSSLVDRLHN